jgi:transmembrane 9 superfamily protein 2/4
MPRFLLGAALALLAPALVAGFYLPGVAPTDYKAGDELRAKVEALTSVRTQLPYEYYVLPFCSGGIDMSNQEALNLGEVLRGSRIYNTPYTFTMGLNQNCRILCHKEYTQVGPTRTYGAPAFPRPCA